MPKPKTPDGSDPLLDPTRETLGIGDWTVEPALNRMSRSGKTVRLEPKAMAVLLYLSQRPKMVVSREALLADLWPGVVVGDESLTQVVIKLRKALGDEAENPVYIETISKGGYRLIARVSRSTVAASRWRRWAWLAAAAAGALLLVAAGLLWLGGKHGGPTDSTRFAAGETSRAAQPLVVVKLFEALSQDPRAELLARGITEDLITDLSRVPGLSVASDVPEPERTEERTPGTAVTSQYLVSGSVQLAGGRVRLHVYLAEGPSGIRLWTERYDRSLSDLFAVQEELALKLLQMLPAKISQVEMQRVANRYTRNLDAYESFLRGQLALQVRQREQNENARELFRQAIAQDAAFGRAYASLALTYCADYRNQWASDGGAALNRALELVQTASDINPDNPEIYWVQAFVHMERRQHEKALRYMDAAVRLYPSYADSYALIGSITTYMGRPAESIPPLRTALRLNPRASQLYFLNLGRAYLFLGDLEQARINLEEAISRNPSNLESQVYMAVLEHTAGNREAADWAATEIRALQSGFSGRAWLETYPMTDAGQKTMILTALEELGL